MSVTSIRKNIIISTFNVAYTGVILFLLYKFLLRELGIEQLGLWSLLVSLSSLVNIANLGFSAGAVKHTAKYMAKAEAEKAMYVIGTSFISSAFIVGIVGILFYPILKYILSISIDDTELKTSYLLIPLSLFSLWLSVMSTTLLSALDGLQRIDLRNYAYMLGYTLFLLLNILAVPYLSIFGVILSQILQYSFLLIIGLYLIKRVFRKFLTFRLRWKKEIFIEIFKYNLNLQIISVSTLLYEPTVKFFLSKFAGLDAVGYYELANRIIIQVRTFIVSAGQTLVPVVAHMYEISKYEVNKLYARMYKMVFLISIPIYSSLLIFMPLAFELWFDEYNRTFILFSLVLTVGWFINTLAVPAYFINLGADAERVRLNVLSQITTAVLNLLLGYTLAKIVGGFGVIIGWTTALIIGALLLISTYKTGYYLKIIRNSMVPLLYHSFIITINFIFGDMSLVSRIALFCTSFISIAVFFYINPMNREFIKLYINRLAFVKS